MREIVSLHVGRCGSGIGAAFWEGLSDEHGLGICGDYEGTSHMQLTHINGFFDEISTNRYVPRAVLCDLDPLGLARIKNWPVGQLFKPANLISGAVDASNNFAKGYGLDQQSPTLAAVLDAVRHEFEVCSGVQSVHLTHSLGGGTGSGLGSLLIEAVEEQFKVPVRTFSLFPSPNSAEVVVEAYNTILAVRHLIRLSDLTMCYDNEALGAAAVKILECARPGVVDNNRLVAMTMLGLTACSRFPGQLSVGINKLSTTLLPLPKLHFLLTGQGVYAGDTGTHYFNDRPVKEVVQRMLQPGSMLASCDYASGKALTAGAIFRGRLPMQTLEASLIDLRTKRAELFPDWLPYNISFGVCDIPPRGDSLSATFLANHSSTVQLFKQQSEQVKLMLTTGKAFFHLFEQEGITEDDMMNAVVEVEDVVKAYEAAVNESGGDGEGQ